MSQPDKFIDSTLETYLGYISGPVGQPSLLEHQVRHYDPKHTMEIAGRLGELEKIPVQIIWGEDDEWQALDWGKKLHKAILGRAFGSFPWEAFNSVRGHRHYQVYLL